MDAVGAKVREVSVEPPKVTQSADARQTGVQAAKTPSSSTNAGAPKVDVFEGELRPEHLTEWFQEVEAKLKKAAVIAGPSPKPIEHASPSSPGTDLLPEGITRRDDTDPETSGGIVKVRTETHWMKKRPLFSDRIITDLTGEHTLLLERLNHRTGKIYRWKGKNLWSDSEGKDVTSKKVFGRSFGAHFISWLKYKLGRGPVPKERWDMKAKPAAAQTEKATDPVVPPTNASAKSPDVPEESPAVFTQKEQALIRTEAIARATKQLGHVGRHDIQALSTEAGVIEKATKQKLAAASPEVRANWYRAERARQVAQARDLTNANRPDKEKDALANRFRSGLTVFSREFDPNHGTYKWGVGTYNKSGGVDSVKQVENLAPKFEVEPKGGRARLEFHVAPDEDGGEASKVVVHIVDDNGAVLREKELKSKGEGLFEGEVELNPGEYVKSDVHYKNGKTIEDVDKSEKGFMLINNEAPKPT